MYKELKALFGGKKPSVRKFTLTLQTLPLEEQTRYYKMAYDAAFTEWDTLPQSYQTFLRDLLMHDKQRTADYLRRHTVLGVLGYPLREPELLRRRSPCWNRVQRRIGIWRLSCYCSSLTRRPSTT